jgi:hypothetical protein
VISTKGVVRTGSPTGLTSRDTLLTDYFGGGGMGGGLASAGLRTLAVCGVYYPARARMTGSAVACLFLVLGSFIGAVFSSRAILGLVLDRSAPRRLKALLRASGQSPSDSIALAGPGATLMNMGLSALLATGYVLTVGGTHRRRRARGAQSVQQRLHCGHRCLDLGAGDHRHSCRAGAAL